jgi:hypothetical protein
VRQLIIVLLITGITTPAFADLRTSAAREASAMVTEAALLAQARPNARGQSDENPYFIPAVVLMGAGGLVTLYGLTHDTGVECSSITLASVSCGTTKSKTTIFTGVGILGVGTYLFYKGKQRSSSPEILAGPNVIAVRQRLVW